ncbi:MAG: hypothetical protein RIF39_09495 [Cyclobacteriaceae bacterium]
MDFFPPESLTGDSAENGGIGDWAMNGELLYAWAHAYPSGVY